MDGQADQDLREAQLARWRQETEDAIQAAVDEITLSPEWRAARVNHVAATVTAYIEKTAKRDRIGVYILLSALLEYAAAGRPELSTFGQSLRDDARWWAEFALPVEIEAYVAAGLTAMQDGHLNNHRFGLPARKRILAAMWESIGDDDRRAFLARVDPKGRFRGRAAA